MPERKEIELEELRSLAFEALKRFQNGKNFWGGGLQYGTIIPEIEYVAAQKGLIPVSGGNFQEAKVTEDEVVKILEIISNFLNEGILMWGLNRSNLAPPFMRITSYGGKVLASEDVVPHDPDGFIKSFKEKVPNVDELILLYLVESIQTFRNNNLLSSLVMLGVASEASFNLLYDSFTKSLTGPKKQKFERLATNISLKTKFDELMKELKRIEPSLPKDISENLESEIGGIFNLIRYQRNDAGHPTGKQTTRDEVFVSLRLFRIYCSKLYKLVTWLANNNI